VGAGSAMLLAAELPSHPELFTSLIEMLGARPGLALESPVPGVIATTTASPSGDRLLHLLNPTGYLAQVRVGFGGTSAEYAVPAHTGHLLARGLTAPFGRIESATSELTAVSEAGLVLAPSLVPDGHRLVLRTDRTVTAAGAHVRREAAALVTVSSPESAVRLTVGVA
jgi:beta-galactosidase